MIEGYDYRAWQYVNKTRVEWRRLIAEAASITHIAGGDMLLKDQRGNIVYEVYDWRRKPTQARLALVKGDEDANHTTP